MKEFVEIDSPWFKGNTKKLASRPWAAFLEQCILQLQYYIDNKMTGDPVHTRNDIDGYRKLIDSGCDKNITMFLDLKRLEKIGEKLPFKDNLARVAYLETTESWRVK